MQPPVNNLPDTALPTRAKQQRSVKLKLAKRMRRLGWICFGLMMTLILIFFVGILILPLDGTDLPAVVRAAFLAALVLFVPTLFLLFGSNLPRVRAHQALEAHGVTADARILRVTPTGMRVNHRPVVRVELDVHPPSQPPFQAETEYWVTTGLPLAHLQPGTQVAVKYDPQSRDVILSEQRA